MKRLVSIFFLFIFLSTGSVFGEVLKLPVLIQHYFEHSTDEEISILDFILEHYDGEIEHHHKKDNHHEKLPFKSIDSHSVEIVSLVTPPLIVFNAVPDFSKSKTPSYYPPLYVNAYLDTIWQPPQFS